MKQRKIREDVTESRIGLPPKGSPLSISSPLRAIRFGIRKGYPMLGNFIKHGKELSIRGILLRCFLIFNLFRKYFFGSVHKGNL